MRIEHDQLAAGSDEQMPSGYGQVSAADTQRTEFDFLLQSRTERIENADSVVCRPEDLRGRDNAAADPEPIGAFLPDVLDITGPRPR